MTKAGRPYVGTPDTRARRQLERILRERTQTDVAESCSLEQQNISAYVRLKMRPGPLARLRMQEVLGIPSEHWFTVEEKKRLHA